MIVFRYLSREVLVTMSAVSAVLLVIIMSGRFIKYLAQAAQGLLDPGSLFLIMAFRIPGFLQLILPLGLFLGILLAYGRLYLESEMTVLSATGMSQKRLLGYTMAPALLVAILVAWLSLFLAPQGINQFALMLNKQDTLTEFDTLVPGRFQAMRDGTRVTYTEELSKDRGELAGIFISQKDLNSSNQERGISILVAEKGTQNIQADGSRYLILHNGYRYDGNPGQANYRAIQYDTYGVMLPKPEASSEVSERDAVPTADLFGSDNPRYQAELQWRLSTPLLVFVVTLLAVPLSRVNPRQGRFLKLLPAILLYMGYLALLIAVRGQLDKGKIPMAIGLWWVHGLFLAIGLLLFYWEPLRLKLASSRAGREVAHG
ncbi:LPS export ABC transporter permease LptF [Pseudomonas aeruginosa]|uniref:LPS export ABC transporter permease LptF n=1 Tax=Pseudomonas aeruginosa TaxID=287 RepID=UPI000BA0BBB1|nr:LPS export ABC transporter permease LptF [Pseudomonas aeruginosa]OZO27956.1 LPS export ABC transporter permease LptF [Pseudomonas aeruginosa]RPW43175.1 LPS export ABC transporter permease LptF [Pseudomonas aeruginosa]RUG57320.1 LPS export ABC transporter permease LptF [Pseudomonas aeruginosa]UTN40340.1 LPS export ABC transporter permease LptF [Pseudomonas aeruginosa]